MKRVLATMAVLCLAASMSSASIFKCWLVPGPMGPDNRFEVKVYGQIVRDTTIGETTASLANKGFSDFAITIYTPGTVGLTEIANSWDTGGPMIDFSTSPINNFGQKGAPAKQDYDRDGDNDAVEFPVADTGSAGVTLGYNTTPPPGGILLAVETWEVFQAGSVTLTPYIANSSRHWQPGTPYTRVEFSGYNAVPTTFTLPTPNILPDPPVVSLSTPSIRFNTSDHADVGAYGVPFTLNQVSGGAIISGKINGVSFTGSAPHEGSADLYLDEGVTSQVFTVGGMGHNYGGNGETTIDVTLLMSPKIHLFVNGAEEEVVDGQVFSTPEFWGNNTVNLSLADSQGFIQTFSIVNPTTGLNWSGSSWSGNSYDLYGPAVTFTVLNDGSGLNSDTMSVQFVPEPATMALLAIGAVGTIIRRRK